MQHTADKLNDIDKQEENELPLSTLRQNQTTFVVNSKNFEWFDASIISWKYDNDSCEKEANYFGTNQSTRSVVNENDFSD